MTVSPNTALPWHERIRVWDHVLASVRARMRELDFREVSTPVRVTAPAVEPFIAPIACAPGWLATSPELAMKRLLCRHRGSMFQIAHCFRHAEVGSLHAEEFHLLEWYRVDDTLETVVHDVEVVVDVVFDVVTRVLELPRPRVAWRTASFLSLLADTTGVQLRGDEGAHELVLVARHVFGDELERAASSDADAELGALRAWTALFSLWSDRVLGPRFAAEPWAGTHIVAFPAVLCALAQTGRAGDQRIACRFESHIGAVELANGYKELGDEEEQRRRFALANRLRSSLGEEPLPIDEAFLSDLRQLGLPSCSGVALGLDRVVMLACARDRLEHVSPFLGTT